MSHRNFERILHFRVMPGSMPVSVSISQTCPFLFWKGADAEVSFWIKRFETSLEKQTIEGFPYTCFAFVHAYQCDLSFCDWDVVLVAFHVGSLKYAVFICGMFCSGLTH